MQRSTSLTGAAQNILTENILTIASKVQTPKLVNGIGVRLTTEITKEGTQNITKILGDGALYVSGEVVAKYSAGDMVEISNCIVSRNNGIYTVRSSLGNLIRLQSLSGFLPKFLEEESHSTCVICKYNSAHTLTSRISKKTIQSIYANGTIIFDSNYILSYNVGDSVILKGCFHTFNNGMYVVNKTNTLVNTMNLLSSKRTKVKLIDETWSTCYIHRPPGTLLLVGARTQLHGTLISVHGDGMADGEVFRIKSHSLQREGKLMHLESKSQASKHVIKIDSYSTVFGNVVALHTRNVKNGTVMHITSSNGNNFVASSSTGSITRTGGKVLHVAGDSESNGCLVHLSCNYFVHGTAMKIQGKGRKSLVSIASTSRYLPMGAF